MATSDERATFNFLASLPRELVSKEKLREKARKEIGESTEWLESYGHNYLQPRDIWMRLIRDLDGLDDFDRRIVALEGRERTAIICQRLPNACAVYKLMRDYSEEACGWMANLSRIELADDGTLKLAILARGLMSWHFGLEDLVVEAFDMDCVSRSAKVGTRAIPGEYLTLEYYLGSKLYDPIKDIARVECSCRKDIVEKVINSPSSQTLGGHVTRWQTNEATENLRVPAILSHGSCCTAFDIPEEFKKKHGKPKPPPFFPTKRKSKNLSKLSKMPQSTSDAILQPTPAQ